MLRIYLQGEIVCGRPLRVSSHIGGEELWLQLEKHYKKLL